MGKKQRKKFTSGGYVPLSPSPTPPTPCSYGPELEPTLNIVAILHKN